MAHKIYIFDGKNDDEMFCDYCNCIHKFTDWGLDLAGNRTLVCDVRQSDALAQTMPKPDYEELNDEIIG